MFRWICVGVGVIAACWLAGCLPAGSGTTGPAALLPSATPAAVIVTITPVPAFTRTGAAQATTTVNIPPTARPTATVIPTKNTQAASDPVFDVCSPLEGIAISELAQPDLLKNPFQAPRPGMDDGHHGADFAYWSRGERNTMLGHPVQSVMSGRVAGVIANRQPYGYAILIETPLEALPASWLAASPVPTAAPTVIPATNLYCPPESMELSGGPGRSLYLLYAHLNQPPRFTPGERVACGEVIGEVGTTGKSVNAHLHLEARVGPEGVTFPEMAHYDNAATNEEMGSYCAWRVSGLFQMFDPLLLLREEAGEALQP